MVNPRSEHSFTTRTLTGSAKMYFFLGVVSVLGIILYSRPSNFVSVGNQQHAGLKFPGNYNETNATNVSEVSSVESVFLDTPRRGSVMVTNVGQICKQLSHSPGVGHVRFQDGCEATSTGNMLGEIYRAALQAFQYNASFQLDCSVGLGKGFEDDSIMAIFNKQIWYQSLGNSTGTVPVPNICDVCTTWPHTCPDGLNHAVVLVQQTLRALPAPDDTEDAVVHVRCGDILKYAHHTEYGYPRYSLYKRLLDNPSSIGIITAPWDNSKCRPNKDCDFVPVCRDIILDMVDYLKSAFPNAEVNVRNNETIVQSYGRMIHAKQMVCSPSTFCVYPAMATLGQSYIIDSPVYPFVNNLQHLQNIKVVKEEFLNMKQVTDFKATGADLATQITAWMRGS